MMKTLTKKLIRIGVLSHLFMIITVTAFAQANFSLFPAGPVVTVNQTFTLEVRVDLNQANNTQLDVAEAYLNFDPAYLQVVSIANGGTLGSIATSSSNNTLGRVDYAAGTTGAPITNDFVLLTVTFQAIALPTGGTTNITFNTALPRQTNSFRSGISNLGTTTGATVTISVVTPITLTDLKARSQDNNVILNWTTATEMNNKGFEIQRSPEGTSWKVLGFVNGAGNSNEENKYSYTDNQLDPGIYYYRLKQEDHDGQFKYSYVVSIKLGSKIFELGQNQPNPFSGRTYINFSLAEKRKVTLTIFDSQGKLIKTVLDETRDAGNHVIDLNLDMLSSGIYYYKLVAGDFTGVKNMVVK